MSHCTKYFIFSNIYGNECLLFLLKPSFYKNHLLVALVVCVEGLEDLKGKMAQKHCNFD